MKMIYWKEIPDNVKVIETKIDFRTDKGDGIYWLGHEAGAAQTTLRHYISRQHTKNKLENIDNLICLESTVVEYNFNDFSTYRNSYNSHTTNKNWKYPKSLIKAAWLECLEFCELYHINARQYKYFKVIYDNNVNYQVDFHTTTDTTGPNISVYNIYFDNKKGKILQRGISI